MARKCTLERAYRALEELASDENATVSISAVARRAGIGRATINQTSDSDWSKFRDTLRERSITRDSTEQKNSQSSYRELRRRLLELEDQVDVMRKRAAEMFNQLVDRVQYYYAISQETPKMRSEKSKLIKELTSQKKYTQELKSQLELAIANNSTLATSAFTAKRIIESKNAVKQTEITIDFLEKIHEFLNKNNGARVVDIFLLCGLPMSGTSDWIEKHSPANPGISLYIDFSVTTENIRKVFLAIIRKEFSADIHCVRIRSEKNTCIKRAEMQISGAAQTLIIQQIEDESSNFEEVHLNEGFNSIIIV
ncbi:hypothetical protein ACNKU7_05640 [Microbulbifer sp. SA54]|uniref:hypothetical protein n=1 Tax=Microbulbifer sp. SA54 TaxID=3401577 RepID=UPI003AAB9FFB